jgi:hypothetical protein
VGVASTVTWSWQGGNCQWLGTLQLNHEVRTQPDRHQPSKVTHSHGVRCDTQTGKPGVVVGVVNRAWQPTRRSRGCTASLRGGGGYHLGLTLALAFKLPVALLQVCVCRAPV